MSPNLFLIIRVLAFYGRALILKNWRIDSCIASTAIAIDVLNHYGIAAEPLCVTLMAFNPVAYGRILAKGAFLDAQESTKAVTEGAWSVGVGFDQMKVENNKWIGHLVTIVDNNKLFDLSLDQVARPQHKMYLKCNDSSAWGCFEIENIEKFLSGEEIFATVTNECLLIYEQKDKDWRQSPDWFEKDRRKSVVSQIIQEIDRRITCPLE